MLLFSFKHIKLHTIHLLCKWLISTLKTYMQFLVFCFSKKRTVQLQEKIKGPKQSYIQKLNLHILFRS